MTKTLEIIVHAITDANRVVDWTRTLFLFCLAR